MSKATTDVVTTTNVQISTRSSLQDRLIEESLADQKQNQLSLKKQLNKIQKQQKTKFGDIYADEYNVDGSEEGNVEVYNDLGYQHKYAEKQTSVAPVINKNRLEFSPGI